ncbi:MAG: S8 family serine peptidase [Hydrogenovibrio sp.]|uniref:S8 family peptidase n=1 Tax=Hydrogenovibrio sp. TaxID=2065821 RepID=UPI00287095E8|nr:S8 family serine peptidase [Hydrogenovibrio sp.]MDR9500033.1 S8 family serine peptidase [Hydrogenovibrio sp.]
MKKNNLKIFLFAALLGHGFVTNASFAATQQQTLTELFHWAEQTYPTFFPSQHEAINHLDEWQYVHYPQTDTYIGYSQLDDNIYVLGGEFGPLTLVGSMDDLLGQANIQIDSNFVSSAHQNLIDRLVYQPNHSYSQTYNHQAAIDVRYAWDRGLTGQGVKVGVIDSGINENHSEFGYGSKINMDESFGLTRRFVLDGTGMSGGDFTYVITDQTQDFDDGHGTHVTSTIMGDKTGIAPGVTEVVFAKTFFEYDDPETGSSYSYGDSGIHTEALKRLSRKGVQIANASVTGLTSSHDPSEIDNMKEALIDNDMGLVVAAGNFGASLTESYEYSTFPDKMLYVEDPAMKENIIYVGAIDNALNDEIAAFSNTPGTNPHLQDRYITTIGVFIMGADNEDTEELKRLSGTSMAAPIVTGAASLLMTNWTNLGASEAFQILLETADKNFADYAPELYGQGKLNIQRALSPVGELTTTSQTQSREYAIANTLAVLPKGLAMQLSDIQQLKSVAFYDDYQRNFQVDLRQSIIDQQPMPYRLSDEMNDFLSAKASTGPVEITPNLSLTMKARPGMSSPAIGVAYTQGSTEFNVQNHTTSLPWQSMGFHAPLEPQYHGSTPTQAVGFGIKQMLTPHLSAFFQHESQADKNRSSQRFTKALQQSQLGLRHHADHHFVKLSVEQTVSKDSLLGMQGTGAWQFGNSTTRQLSLYADYDLATSLKAFAGGQYGKLDHYQAPTNSFIQKLDDVTYYSGYTGLTFQQDNLKAGFMLSVPQTMTSGTMQLDIAGVEQSNIAIASSRVFTKAQAFVESSLFRMDYRVAYHYDELLGDNRLNGIVRYEF